MGTRKHEIDAYHTRMSERTAIYFSVWANICFVCSVCDLREFLDILVITTLFLITALIGSAFRLAAIKEECLTLALVIVSHLPLLSAAEVFLYRFHGIGMSMSVPALVYITAIIATKKEVNC